MSRPRSKLMAAWLAIPLPTDRYMKAPEAQENAALPNNDLEMVHRYTDPLHQHERWTFGSMRVLRANPVGMVA